MERWRTAMHQLGIKQSPSTARHPQTDGQSERTIRSNKNAFKISTNNGNSSWIQQLPFIEFSQNYKPQESTGYSPFEAVYGFSPRIPDPLITNRISPIESNDFNSRHQEIMEGWLKIKDNLVTAQRKQKTQADKKRRLVEFQIGDKVRFQQQKLFQTT